MPWSPSSVNDWLACPRLWWLKRQRVVGRARDETAMEMGSAFHVAMAHVWTLTGDEGSIDCGDPIVARAVVKVMAQEGEALREQGIVGVEVNLDGDDAEAARHGRYPGTCDLITDNGSGLTVTDYKTKKNMDAKYADGELRETQRSWQLKQYAWFVQQKYNRPVTHVRKLLVAFAPSLKVWLVSYPVTQQELSSWYTQAQLIWNIMDEMNEWTLDMIGIVWQNANSCERYGYQYRCTMYDVCWNGAEINREESE